MTAAPLVATAETNPRSIKSMRIGPRPVLITCAPMPQAMPLVRFAATIARTMALRAAAARMFGSEAMKSPMPDAIHGRPKSLVRTLLTRDLIGYVLTPDRSNSSYGNGMNGLLRYSNRRSGELENW